MSKLRKVLSVRKKKKQMKIGALNYNRANPSEKIKAGAAGRGGGAGGGAGKGVGYECRKASVNRA